MTIAASTIIDGPAIITYNSDVYYCEGDITVSVNKTWSDLMTSVFGRIDRVLSDIMIDIEFTPIEWTNLSTLYPHTTPTIMGSIFGAVAKDVTINTLAGKQLVYKRGGITQIPSLNLSSIRPPIAGPCKITCLGSDDEAWSAAAHRVAVSDVAFSDTSFTNTVPTVNLAVAWGGDSPWDDIETEEGVQLNFAQNLRSVMVDNYGTVDMRLQWLNISGSFKPVGVTEANLHSLLAIQDTGVLRGIKASANAEDLVVSGTGVYVLVDNAAIDASGLRFGLDANRQEAVTFEAVRDFTAGAAGRMYYVGAAAPE